MVSPFLCGSSKAVEIPSTSTEMKSAASFEKIEGRTDFASRVKNFLTTSPLKKRRAISLSALNSDAASSLVFGVPLVDLVTQEGNDVPKIVRRVVEHVEEEGLDQEGIYRVNGNAKVIEKLKTSFDKVGDAEFRNQDIAAVAGLMKLFLRLLPTPLIPDDQLSQYVEIQQAYPGPATPEGLQHLRDEVATLPNVNYTLLKYLIQHLHTVSQHSDENKMTAVSLSIVFGPNIFRCGGGLEGLRQQGYTNTVVCRMVQNFHDVFEHTLSSPISPPEAPIKLREGRKRPSKPRPYSEHIWVKKQEQDLLQPPISPLAMVSFSFEEEPELPEQGRERSYSERSVDEAVERSSGTLSPTSPTVGLEVSIEDIKSPQSPMVPCNVTVEPYNEEDSNGETGKFHRQRGLRMKRKSYETGGSGTADSKILLPESPPGKPRSDLGTPTKTPPAGISFAITNSAPKQTVPILKHPHISALNSREESDTTIRTPSPYSWQSSPGTTPPTSPSLTPRSSRVINSVIEESVKRFLFEPSSPAGRRRQPESLKQLSNRKDGKVVRSDVYGLLLPNTNDSSHRKRTKQSSMETKEPDATDIHLREVDEIDSTTVGDTANARNHKNVVRRDTESQKVKPQTKAGGEHYRDAVLHDDNLCKDSLDVVSEMQPAVRLRSSRDDNQSKKLRNRRSALYGEDTGSSGSASGGLEDMNIHILSVSPEHTREGLPLDEVLLKTGKVSELVQQFDETDSRTSTMGADSSKRRKGSPPLKKRPTTKVFEMFEQSGLIMGMNVCISPRHDTTPHHVPITSESTSPQSRPLLSTASDVFVSPEHSGTSLKLEEFDAVKSSEVLEHRVMNRTINSQEADHEEVTFTDCLLDSTRMNLTRPKGPARRKPHKTRSRPTINEKDVSNISIPSPKHKHHCRYHGMLEPLPKASHTMKIAKDPGLDLTSLAPESHHREVREGWKEIGIGKDETETPLQSAKELNYQILKLRATIKEFEVRFSAEHGHKPSGSERNPVRSQLEERSRLRKKLKVLKESVTSDDRLSKSAPPELHNVAVEGNESPLFPAAVTGGVIGENPLKVTLDRLLAILEEKRRKGGRPYELKRMSSEQIMTEKQSTQKALLQFEKYHGRPKSQHDKETMRPLYDRYRLIKKVLASGDTEMEHATVIASEASLEATGSSLPSVTLLQSPILTKSLPVEPIQEWQKGEKVSKSAVQLTNPKRSGSPENDWLSERELHKASVMELHRQRDMALATKKNLRAILKDYENGYMAMHGRAVCREDRKPMQKEYGEYKSIKARLKLIETLVVGEDLQKNL